jgi:hypothetical protein
MTDSDDVRDLAAHLRPRIAYKRASIHGQNSSYTARYAPYDIKIINQRGSRGGFGVQVSLAGIHEPWDHAHTLDDAKKVAALLVARKIMVH